MRISWILPLLLGTLLSSCATIGYKADFNKAVKAAPETHTDPTGPWKGTWKSHWNDHTGPLWCMISPSEDSKGHYDFRYHAGWGVVEFGDFTHQVKTSIQRDGSLPVNGDMELAGFVGTYSVDGKVTKDTFKATYKSTKGDHGIMTMTRPKPEE